MTRSALSVSIETVRRLVITKQRLSGKLPRAVRPDTLLSVVRDLGYVQWDPVTTVAPSHLLSFWARLGRFNPSVLDRLLWRDKTLFLHWTPIASLVLTEDYPFYLAFMKRYPESMTSSWGRQRAAARRFLGAHTALRRRILNQLENGPRTVAEIEEHRTTKRSAVDWDAGSDASEMLFHLLMRGEVMVVGHRGAQNVWGLSNEFLPSWTDRTPLSEAEAESQGAQRGLRALGTATPRELFLYFPRGRLGNLPATLRRLEEDSKIHRLSIQGLGRNGAGYVHVSDLSLLDALASRPLERRISLLPPFDTMLSNPARIDRLFGFHYIREQFLPKEKRKYGTYVLPIVYGENLIGRIDPQLDKKTGTLNVHSVHAEPGAPSDARVAEAIGDTISDLARFVGARRVTYTSRVPTAWKRGLEGSDGLWDEP